MKNKMLDEMQVANRNRIGNSSFLLMLYLLLLDAGLYGFGFRWIAYPANVMVLVSLCGGLYIVRLIAAGAFGGRPHPVGILLSKVS